MKKWWMKPMGILIMLFTAVGDGKLTVVVGVVWVLKLS